MALKAPPKFVNEAELAEYFGIPRKVVTDKSRSGEWPHYMIGGHRVYQLDEIVRRAIGVDGEGTPDAK